MICPECKGRGEAIYCFVDKDREKNTLTFIEKRDICRTCNGSGKMPMTNADRIRVMSDEELKYIVRAVINAEDCPMGGTDCKDCVFHDLCLRGDYYYNKEEEWLKQPVETPTTNADRCVCCGAIIPEGSMVCTNCHGEKEGATDG